MKSYAAARSFFSICAFLSWSAIILGIILMVIAVSTISQFAGGNPMALMGAAAPGLIIAVIGLFFLINVQIGRAGVDSTEYAQQSLKVARDQLAFAKQARLEVLGDGTSMPVQASMGVVVPPTGTPPQNTEPAFQGDTLIYNGKTITKLAKGYRVDGISFGNLNEAKTYIGTIAERSKALES